ncbi:MAG: glycosyltransferase family 39 protein [Gammaproteobacteria bacterium]
MADKYHNIYALIFILFLSLWIRVSYDKHTMIDTSIRGDTIHYLQYAKNLLNHSTFSKEAGSEAPVPDAYWAPGYPAFLAAVILVAEILHIHAYQLIVYLQALLGALTAVFTFLIARLFMDIKWALLPAIFVALSPHLVSLGDDLLTETLYGFFLTASVYVFLLAFRNKTAIQYAAAGVLFGLAWLINPVMFFVPVFFILTAVFLYRRENSSRSNSAAKGMAMCLVIFFAIAGAWQARGIFDVPPDAPSGADRLLTNLVIGSHSDYYRIWRANPRDESNPANRDMKRLNGSYPAFARLMFHRVVRHPWHYLKWYFVDKPLLLWGWNIQVGQGDIYIFPVMQSLYQTSRLASATYSIMKSLHYWFFGLALVGIVFLFVRRRQDDIAVPAFLYICLVYISSVYVITQSEPRYSLPLRPEYFICAVFSIKMIVERLNMQRLKYAGTQEEPSNQTGSMNAG